MQQPDFVAGVGSSSELKSRHQVDVGINVNSQGSHSDWKTWKTWKNGKAFSSQGKVREF